MAREVFQRWGNKSCSNIVRKGAYVSMLCLWNTSWYDLKAYRSVEENVLAQSGTGILQDRCNKVWESLRLCIRQTGWSRGKKNLSRISEMAKRRDQQVQGNSRMCQEKQGHRMTWGIVGRKQQSGVCSESKWCYLLWEGLRGTSCMDVAVTWWIII